MPQKHPQARDRSQRLGSLKHAQTMPVSVLEVAGPDDVAELFAFFISLRLPRSQVCYHRTKRSHHMLDNRNSIYVLRLPKPVCSSAVSGGNAFHLQVVLPAQPEKKKLHPAQCQDMALLKHIPNVSSIAAGRVAKATSYTVTWVCSYPVLTSGC